MRAALKNDPSATALVATGGSGRPTCAGPASHFAPTTDSWPGA
ncbi:hypothetical protein ABR738_09565 [Streptomyces sp. Edi4]